MAKKLIAPNGAIDSTKWVNGKHQTVQPIPDNKPYSKTNVNVSSKGKSKLSELENIDQPSEKSNLITEDILRQLGDNHSKNYYRTVAMKIPEDVIRKLLSEIKMGGARNPAKVFTSAITKFISEQGRGVDIKFSLEKTRADLARKFRTS